LAFGSRVPSEQVKEAVEAVGGELLEMSTTVKVESPDETKTEATPVPCVVNFLDQKSCEKFIDSVRQLPLYITPAPPPPKQSRYKVSINIVIPTRFGPTRLLEDIPETKILWLALLKRRLSQTDEPLLTQYISEYKVARKSVMQTSGYTSNPETEEELDRLIEKVLAEINEREHSKKA
jgi:hypothetical protein